MLKGSFSSNVLRGLVWLLVVLREEDVVQNDFRSGGEGGTKTPLSLISERYGVSMAWSSDPFH